MRYVNAAPTPGGGAMRTSEMSQTVERHEFQGRGQATVGPDGPLLYSNKDVFLRELVSNASDALDKPRFERLTRAELGAGNELEIRLETDAEKRTLSISDDGIRDDPRRGDQEHRHHRQERDQGISEQRQGRAKSEVPPELIGQFGVGFYSAFMVADKVTVVTRRAGEEKATIWESIGDGSYTIVEGERVGSGMTITLSLKPEDKEQGLRDYTSESVIREIVKHYSDFVAYPIRMGVWRKDEKAPDAKVLEDRTLNSTKAIWDRPKGEVTEEEYREFYGTSLTTGTSRSRTFAYPYGGDDRGVRPALSPHQGPLRSLQPRDEARRAALREARLRDGRVQGSLPTNLRFVKGVVDAHDLSLNVSREILQKDRQIQIIRKQLVKTGRPPSTR